MAQNPKYGCSTGTDSLTLDFATVVYRLQLLGFNAVRLPFSFVDLYDTPPKSQTRSCPQVRLVHPYLCCRSLFDEPLILLTSIWHYCGAL